MAVLALALTAAGCANSTSGSSSGSASAPGVTATEIKVGSIADVTGILSSDFSPVVAGVRAYFSMVNAAGGVDGRKLVMAYAKDDQGSPTTDLTVAQQLVEQNGVFAVVGVGTPFFGSASYLARKGVPTFGYQVSTEWNSGPSLYGAYGSVLDYSSGQMVDAYLAKQLHAASIGVVAYGVTQSASACQAAIQGFNAFGVPVGFSDLSFGIATDPTPDVLQMKAHHVDVVFTCLDVSGNVAFAQSLSQNGVNAKAIWLNGYDRSVLQQYGSLLNGTVVLVQHVPFEARDSFPGVYPALETYLSTMAKYQPAAEYSEVAMDGWINAAQFVAGLQAAGRDLTQAKLVAALNKMTGFTAGGLMPPVNWTKAHTDAAPPYCSSYVQVQGGKFVPVFVQGTSSVFTCFDRGSDTPVAPPSGTPGT
jgi:ABC-type branched-subunit amino acid transport system substrate-binding protein